MGQEQEPLLPEAVLSDPVASVGEHHSVGMKDWELSFTQPRTQSPRPPRHPSPTYYSRILNWLKDLSTDPLGGGGQRSGRA